LHKGRMRNEKQLGKRRSYRNASERFHEKTISNSLNK
jgi:hypothetical protein